MAKRESKKGKEALEMKRYGTAWRSFLKEILIAKVDTVAKRKELAKEMGVSGHYVHSMLFRDEGGIDAWAAAISIAYKIKPKEISSLIPDVKHVLASNSDSKAERILKDLRSSLSEDDQFYWFSMLSALLETDRQVRKK